MDKKVITWRGTISLCGRIVKKLKDKYPNILDYKIIGLSRGGLIPAVIISNMLNIRKVYSLGLKSYEEERQGEVEIYQVPEISTMDRILLIDDISDSGTSFKLTKDMLIDKEVITASLFLKHKTAFKPNVYGKIVPDDLWVVFPWE
jgi:hypoxanthine phosphoribosyltransferase